MIKVLFVCLGNICRSPMAEFVFKDLIKKNNLSKDFLIESAATSSEEVENPVHYGTRNQLAKYGISCNGKRARKITPNDYFEYDYIIGMESRNVVNMLRIFNGDPYNKIKRLLDYSVNPRDIADPWYTGNFEKTYEDIVEGCNAFLEFLRNEKVF